MDAIELLQDRVDELAAVVARLKQSDHVPEPHDMLHLLELNDALADVGDQLSEHAKHPRDAPEDVCGCDATAAWGETPQYRQTRMAFWKTFMPAMVAWWASQGVETQALAA